jgi:hypothetical protein
VYIYDGGDFMYIDMNMYIMNIFMSIQVLLAYKNLKAKRREDMMVTTFGKGKRSFVGTNDFA